MDDKTFQILEQLLQTLLQGEKEGKRDVAFGVAIGTLGMLIRQMHETNAESM